MLGIQYDQQNGIPVRVGWIRTRHDVEMCSGYIGRGGQNVTAVIPAGTIVRYKELLYNGKYLAYSGEPITKTVHKITLPANKSPYNIPMHAHKEVHHSKESDDDLI